MPRPPALSRFVEFDVILSWYQTLPGLFLPAQRTSLAHAADGRSREAASVKPQAAADEPAGGAFSEPSARAEVRQLAPVNQHRFDAGHAVGDARADDNPLGGDGERPLGQLGQER